MISQDHVVMAYRLILGREPESDAVIDSLAKGCRDLAELRTKMLASPEFAVRFSQLRGAESPPVHPPLGWPPMQVEIEVPEATLQAMLARIASEFRHLGDTEPYWSVVSEDRFRSDQITGNRDDFVASGEGVVNEFRATAHRCGVDFSQLFSCLELGCGTARSTVWLANLFWQVRACDVSPQHLALAQELLRERSIKNVELTLIDGLPALQQVPGFDVLFSIIVLQHNPPPLIAFMLRELLKKLNPGGVAYFQVPTYIFNYSFVASNYFSRPPVLGTPEMHALPQSQLARIIEETGCKILEIREDDAAGSEAISNRLLVRKV